MASGTSPPALHPEVPGPDRAFQAGSAAATSVASINETPGVGNGGGSGGAGSPARLELTTDDLAEQGGGGPSRG